MRPHKPLTDVPPDWKKNGRWLAPDEVAEILAKSSADPALRTDLKRFAGDTTDDLGPIH
jgi:hypothetical protein